MWKYNNSVRLYFGEGAVLNLKGILNEGGFEKVVLFSRKISKLSETARQALGSSMDKIIKVIDDINPEPTTSDISRFALSLKGLEFDAVIAMGGGSVIDSAKATMAVHANKCSIDDFMEKKATFSSAVPLIAIPTTSGTGSEVTRAAALTWNGKKQPIFDDTLYPSISIIDPELTYSCPPSVTATCGLDVLSHACESLMHKAANPISESLAKDAIRLCIKSLEVCYLEPSNKAARRDMCEASMKAGMAIAACGCSASHACSYMLSTDFGVSHGEACAFTLDKLITLCAIHDTRFDDIAIELGFDCADGFTKWVKELKQKLNAHSTLKDIGASEEDRARLIEAGYSSVVLKNHYFELTKENIETLFATT